MLQPHMRTYKFKKVRGCDKVFVKLTGFNYISCLKPVAFVKDFFYRFLDQKFETLP
jgi:hypothetical protein